MSDRVLCLFDIDEATGASWIPRIVDSNAVDIIGLKSLTCVDGRRHVESAATAL